MELTTDRIIMLFSCGILSAVATTVVTFVGVFNRCWTVFGTLWAMTSAIYLWRASLNIDPKKKGVIVTGCDTGFGYALALHLDTLGYRVFAGCLFADTNGDGAKSLRENGSQKLHVIQLDVTSEEQVKKSRKTVEDLLPKDEEIWGIVNNAGIATLGDMEWTPLSVFRKSFDVNVFGAISATKMFLPHIRKSKGRVVNIASMFGRVVVSMRSAYATSKHAVEGLSGCLRQEMNQWGVKVIVLEPGNYIAGTKALTLESVRRQKDDLWRVMSDEVKRDYKEDFENRVGKLMGYTNAGETDISPVVRAYADALTQKYPQTRYNPMTPYYMIRTLVATHLPDVVYDYFYPGVPTKK